MAERIGEIFLRAESLFLLAVTAFVATTWRPSVPWPHRP